MLDRWFRRQKPKKKGIGKSIQRYNSTRKIKSLEQKKIDKIDKLLDEAPEFKIFILDIYYSEQKPKVKEKFIVSLGWFLIEAQKANIKIDFEVLKENIKKIPKEEAASHLKICWYFACLTGDIKLLQHVFSTLDKAGDFFLRTLYSYLTLTNTDLTQRFKLKFKNTDYFDVDLAAIGQQIALEETEKESLKNKKEKENDEEQTLSSQIHAAQPVIFSTNQKQDDIVITKNLLNQIEVHRQGGQNESQINNDEIPDMPEIIITPPPVEAIDFKETLVKVKQVDSACFSIGEDDEQGTINFRPQLKVQSTPPKKRNVVNIDGVDKALNKLSNSNEAIKQELQLRHDQIILSQQIQETIRQFVDQKPKPKNDAIVKLYELSNKLEDYKGKWSLWQLPWQNKKETKTAKKISKIVDNATVNNVNDLTNEEAKQVLKRIDKKLEEKINHYSFFRKQSTVDKYQSLRVDIAKVRFY